MDDALPSFDQLQDDSHVNAMPIEQGVANAQPPTSFDALQDDSEKYGTLGQQAKAGLEGVAKGVLGPAAPLIEKNALHVSEEAIKGREEENPITHGVGQALGLAGSMFTGKGEGAVMLKAGELAAEAAGLSAPTTYAAKVGSSIVKQATEMAVLQSGDEVSKMILHDPNTSAQSAIANVGLAAALGGAGGAFITGAVSPLWKATAGPKVEKLLGVVKNHLDGTPVLLLPEELATAEQTLGIKIPPVMRAGISGNAEAGSIFSNLRRSEHPEVLQHIKDLNENISSSVMESLGLKAEQVAEYSENEAGHTLASTFEKEIKDKYDPIAEKLAQRDAEAAPIHISDDARLDHSGKLIEKGLMEQGANSPYYKEYEHFSQRLLDAENIGAVDKLKSEIGNRLRGMVGPQTDYNTVKVLQDIKGSLGNFQESQIEKAAIAADREAIARTRVPGMPRVNVGEIPSVQPAAQELIARRAFTNQQYAKYANMNDELMGHLGIGKFSGTGGLLSKITEKIAPEDLLKKFSIKGNADLIPFLKEHFPETFQKVIENERKQLVKPAILAAGKKGEVPVDVKKLAEVIQKGLAGRKEYVESVLPAEAIKRVEAGRLLANAVPTPRDSGTPAGLVKILKYMPASAVAAISWATGHGPIAGFMAGEMGSRLGKEAPEAIKLAWLKFLSSDQPITSTGFKAMVDFMHNTIKGQSLLVKATSNVFKATAQVLPTSQMPDSADREKLDKIVTKYQDKPEQMLKLTKGDTGHYMPDHQTALTQSTAQAVQYLQSIKPHPIQTGPLDKPVEPRPDETARYNRALDIANSPAIVLQHIKDGTLLPSDLKDLKGMYPAVYSDMTQKLSNEMINNHSNEEHIPYKTRMGISLFLGQPIDSSMGYLSILSAQPKPKGQPNQPGQQQQGKMGKGSSTALNKMSKPYMTPSQASEAHKAEKD